jgi:hypothetical protein
VKRFNEQVIRERLQYYEERARAYRFLLEDYTAHQTESKQRESSTVLAKAIALDSQRRAGSKAPRKAGKASAKKPIVASGPGWRQRKIAYRESIKAWLDSTFSRDEPRPYVQGSNGGPARVSPYLNAGYLKKKGDGLYIRTAKEFDVMTFTSGG